MPSCRASRCRCARCVRRGSSDAAPWTRLYRPQFDALHRLMFRARCPPRGLHVDGGQATSDVALAACVSLLPRAFAAVSGIAKAAAVTIITTIVRIPPPLARWSAAPGRGRSPRRYPIPAQTGQCKTGVRRSAKAGRAVPADRRRDRAPTGSAGSRRCAPPASACRCWPGISARPRRGSSACPGSPACRRPGG